MSEEDEKFKKLLKDAFQDQVDDWLDRKFSQFGKFSIVAIGAATFWALLHFVDWANGMHK